MQTADNQGIYSILEQLLRATSEPLTCVDLLKNPLTKPNIQIIEEGDRVVLDFPDFTITVQSKKP